MSKSVLVIDTPKNCMECHLLTLLMIGESQRAWRLEIMYIQTN